MRTIHLVAVALLAGSAACTPSASKSPFPWLVGFSPAASNDSETADVSDRLATATGVDEVAGYGGLELHAQLGSAPGAPATILASVHQGVAVLDEAGQVLARAPGAAPEGSSDDLVALAVGDGQLAAPVIALALTTGGHRTSTTSLVLYQVGDGGRLEPLFDQPVEERDGDATSTGSVTLLPRALIYRTPAGETSLWQFDGARHRYVRTQALDAPRRTPDHAA